LLRLRQRCALFLPPDSDPLAEFARERPERLGEVPLPPPAPPALEVDVREAPREAAAVPMPGAVGGSRLRAWLRPFWAGCAVGGMVAGWLAFGWPGVGAPAGASVVSPPAREVEADAVEASRASSDELFAPPELRPPPAVAYAARASELPPPTPPAPTPVPPSPVAAVPRSPVAPARFEGSLAVDSTPARARVFINGEPVGVTPMIMTRLPIGSRAIRLEAEDHEPWWSVVQVVAERQTSVRVALPRSAPAVSSLAP